MDIKLADFQGFIFDLDGVMYKGDTPIDGAIDCIDCLLRHKKKYVFVTNHTKHTREGLVNVLRGMGIPLVDNQIVSANHAAIDHLRESMPSGEIRVNLIGHGGIVEEFARAGFVQTTNNPQFVVVAWDPTFNYEKLRVACMNVRNGARFVVISPDRYIPAEHGLELGFGTLGAGIMYATGVEPTHVGKPYPPIINAACRIMGTNASETIIVGDTPETDLRSRTLAHLGGSVLVLSGTTLRNDVPFIAMDETPTFVLNSVKEFAEHFAQAT